MIVDFRSDTITKPTPGMLEAMWQAQVGDDVFEDDPSVKELEQKAAELFGVQQALFCVSGTMANQLAIKGHTQPGGEVICHENSHIYLYEGGGIALNAGCSVKLLSAERGLLKAAQIKPAIRNVEDIHYPQSQLVSLENTMNKGGGACYELRDLEEIKAVCVNNDLKFHLDGARLFNAIIAKEQSTLIYGELFDSISVCLSKGLGCPVGSLLLGSTSFIKKARRNRKAMGGGWRQAGYLAAAGIYALDHHVQRLKEDHEKADTLAKAVNTISYVEEVYPTETNIVIFRLAAEISAEAYVQRLSEKGIKCVVFGPDLIRFVTHLDIKDEQMDFALQELKNINF